VSKANICVSFKDIPIQEDILGLDRHGRRVNRLSLKGNLVKLRHYGSAVTILTESSQVAWLVPRLDPQHNVFSPTLQNLHLDFTAEGLAVDLQVTVVLPPDLL